MLREEENVEGGSERRERDRMEGVIVRGSNASRFAMMLVVCLASSPQSHSS